ncbi:hypothetical protein [Dermatophilus congolensis]|uniref:Uncharacterized protein n=1 Tax=Dermatophilus congolensis TaxID=1863 RepID=A0A239VIW6_9MICO|nr:hypothetical protein [Dermatophilus congolensis]MBO3129069.1 hypothetical protein [Dermatophilus congolensis]MBO3132295.1 hypothetical protein [Dermatophilus congolensis]MBO3133545.1 hypothetical protein [Dermatophilus congolensis]MBO3135778.1 hypothetical protein [Dermatophilus congolensis]MBO3138018.1 hypothetical protein [Dermatophilus congolensis]
MRWERLFSDLEGMADEQDRAFLESEIADRVRRELARVELSDRLRANDGRICLVLRGGRMLSGDLIDAGADWLLMENREQVLVPLHAVMEVNGLGRAVAAPSDMRKRLSMSHALRVIARHRVPVAVEDEMRRVRTGTIDIVGADFFELAGHAPDVPRSARYVQGVKIVPFSAVVAVTTLANQRNSSMRSSAESSALWGDSAR